MRSIGSQPLGGLLLVVLAAGLFGYALWKVMQGVMDPDDRGSEAHGIVRRVCYVGSGAIHAGLAFTAAQSVFGAEDSSEDALAASVMAYQPPLGRILVAAVGVGVICVGLYQLHAAYGAKFKDELRLHRMRGPEEFFVTLVGRVGTAARALALGLAGAFVLLATYQSDPQETRGLGGPWRPCNSNPWAPSCSVRWPLASYSTAPSCSSLLGTGTSTHLNVWPGVIFDFSSAKVGAIQRPGKLAPGSNGWPASGMRPTGSST